MARLIDTNILVYAFDPRDRAKQRIAMETLRAGQASGNLYLPHQAIVEFVAAVSRPRPDLGGASLLPRVEAANEAALFLQQFEIIWPDEAIVRAALHGTIFFGLSWYDAHLWAYAEVHGLSEILSEDFEHGRYFGSVRIMNPFLQAEGGVHELPEMYAPA